MVLETFERVTMKQFIDHTWYGTSYFTKWGDLVDAAKREASRIHGYNEWKLLGVYEYDREVFDERGKPIDIEARVIVRHVMD